jgi:hypothetical protein
MEFVVNTVAAEGIRHVSVENVTDKSEVNTHTIKSGGHLVGCRL